MRRIFGFSLLTMSLAACAPIPPANTGPVVAMPNVALDKGYDGRPSSPPLTQNNSDTLQSPSMAAERWQDYYQDPKLQSLIAIGLENNKDVEQTLLAIRRAAAQYQVTDNTDLPTLNASGGYSRSATNAIDKNPDSGYTVNLGMANYELDFWGRIASLKEQALQNFLATTAARDTAKVSLIANIASSYVALSYNMMQFELASKTLESRLKSLRITQARLQAGIDPKTPSLRAAVAADDAYIAKLEAQRNVEKGRSALQYLIGTPIPDALLPTPAVKSLTDKATFSPGLPSELLRYRPDILQAEYELKAAGANIEVARAAYYPSISLAGRLGYSSNELSDLFKSSAAGWSFGPSISVPIFDAGQLDANYEVAQIDQEQALLRYERAIETAFREVNDVLTDQATLDARLAAEYRLQENYKEIVAIAEARYQAQVDDYLSVLDAQRSQFATQQRIVNLEQERVMNQVEMYRVLGGGANLVEPKAIPLTNNKNLVNLLTPTTHDEKALAAVRAASSATLITPREAALFQAAKPTTVIRSEVVDVANIDADAEPDVAIAQITRVIEAPLISIKPVPSEVATHRVFSPVEPSMRSNPTTAPTVIREPAVNEQRNNKPLIETSEIEAPVIETSEVERSEVEISEIETPVTEISTVETQTVAKEIDNQSVMAISSTEAVDTVAVIKAVDTSDTRTTTPATNLSNNSSNSNNSNSNSLNSNNSNTVTLETDISDDTLNAKVLQTPSLSSPAAPIETQLNAIPSNDNDEALAEGEKTTYKSIKSVSFRDR